MESIEVAKVQIGNQNRMPFEQVLHSNLEKSEKIRIVAREFESLFLEQMLKEADKTIPYKNNVLYAGQAEEIFRGMYRQELARSMADAGGIGLADILAQEMEQTHNSNE